MFVDKSRILFIINACSNFFAKKVISFSQLYGVEQKEKAEFSI